MAEKTAYFVLKEKAVPEVLLKVVEAKRLVDSGRAASVQDATEMVGISRSSFYQLDDEPGLLSTVLNVIAEFHVNILTIHQSIPINGIASLTFSMDVLPQTGDIEEMVHRVELLSGVHYVKILARE